MGIRKGLTMMEVVIALLILGVIATIFAQTTRVSQRISGKSQNWDQEGIVIESVLENLRVDYTLPALRSLDSSWVDRTGQYPISMHVSGSTPQVADVPGYPVSRLAKILVRARRDDIPDSLETTTFILVP